MKPILRVAKHPTTVAVRILLIEDDEMIGTSFTQAMRAAGFAVDWVRDGIAGQSALCAGGYVAALLDLGLPRRAGFDVLRAARSQGVHTPVLILTARDALEDRVAGLDLGADDYIVKPFELPELLARLRAVIRRYDGHAQSAVGTEELRLDLRTREITYRGVCASLSAREFALLHALLERPGAILSRQQLEERIYGWDDAVSSNAVEVIIHGLRRRFGPDLIRNVRGLGWKISKGEA
jgi:two-component system OmpR family response regulator/two-component system response regulator QseB